VAASNIIKERIINFEAINYKAITGILPGERKKERGLNTL